MARVTHAQVIVSPLSGGRVTVGEMVDQLIIGSGTIQVLNTSYTGAPSAAGAFTGGNQALGFSAGVVLSTGLASNLVGATRPSTQLGQPGSAQHFSGTTSDAALLSFSFIPSGDKISFRLRFLTIEGFGSAYNDAFGIFVNGNDPGSNVARLPNGNPVTVSNIAVSGPYYESGELLGLNDFYKVSPSGSSIILQADAAVRPNQQNTITFVIADARDSRVDSVVLIEAGTFYSNSTPQLVTALGDQRVVVSSPLSLQIPDTTFSDADSGDLLTYSATLSSGAPLPQWLRFNPSTRVLSGVPTTSDIGSVTVRITATDPKSAFATTDFVVTVFQPTATPTPTPTPTPTSPPPVASGDLIVGRAVAADGTGVPNVVVYVRESSSGSVHGGAITDGLGEFVVAGVTTSQRYSITLSRTGFAFPVREALPGVPVVVEGVRVDGMAAQCKARDIAARIAAIHQLGCQLRTEAVAGTTPTATRALQAKRRVQTTLDNLTVWLDEVPEVVLQCSRSTQCTKVELTKTLKRLPASFVALRRGARAYAALITSRSRSTGRGDGRERRIARLHSRALAALEKLPRATFKCPAGK